MIWVKILSNALDNKYENVGMVHCRVSGVGCRVSGGGFVKNHEPKSMFDFKQHRRPKHYQRPVSAPGL
jgi:hypothetical protein